MAGVTQYCGAIYTLPPHVTCTCVMDLGSNPSQLIISALHIVFFCSLPSFSLIQVEIVPLIQVEIVLFATHATGKSKGISVGEHKKFSQRTVMLMVQCDVTYVKPHSRQITNLQLTHKVCPECRKLTQSYHKYTSNIALRLTPLLQYCNTPHQVITEVSSTCSMMVVYCDEAVPDSSHLPCVLFHVFNHVHRPCTLHGLCILIRTIISPD